MNFSGSTSSGGVWGEHPDIRAFSQEMRNERLNWAMRAFFRVEQAECSHFWRKGLWPTRWWES